MFEPCENFSDLVVFVALKLDERLVGKCFDGYFFQLCKFMVGGKHGAQLVLLKGQFVQRIAGWQSGECAVDAPACQRAFEFFVIA